MNVSTNSAPRPKKDNFVSRSTTKRCQQSNSIHSSPDKSWCTEVSDILLSIDNKLCRWDARIALVEVLHKEFQQLRESLEFSQQQLTALQKKTNPYNTWLLPSQPSSPLLLRKTKAMKETILDLQSCSMRDNLVFSTRANTWRQSRTVDTGIFDHSKSPQTQ